MAGQPTVMTEPVLQNIGLAFMLNCNITQACQLAEVSRESYYSFIQRNPEYADKFMQLRNYPIAKSKQVIGKALQENDTKTAQWVLERLDRKNYGLKTDINISVEATYTDKQIDTRIKQLAHQNSLLEAPDGAVDGEYTENE